MFEHSLVLINGEKECAAKPVYSGYSHRVISQLTSSHTVFYGFVFLVYEMEQNRISIVQ